MAWTALTICRSDAPPGDRARIAIWPNSGLLTQPRLPTPALMTSAGPTPSPTPCRARPQLRPAPGTAELPEFELRSAHQREHDPEGQRDDVEDQPQDHHNGIDDGGQHARHLPRGRSICTVCA